MYRNIIFLHILLLTMLSILGCATTPQKPLPPTVYVNWHNPTVPIRQVPEYTKAWPTQVEVKKPDPLLGDKQLIEQWIYGEEFVKRFKDFPLALIDHDLQKSAIKAIAIRFFKKNHWEGLDPNYPEQYTIDVDIYFDSKLSIPLKNYEYPVRKYDTYPKGIEESFKNLHPYNQQDSMDLMNSRPTKFLLKQAPIWFTVPLDKRYGKAVYTYYYPELLHGLSLITFRMSQTVSKFVVPIQANGYIWLSLYGEIPYNDKSDIPKGSYTIGINETVKSIFEPGAHPEQQGYLQLPRSYYEILLPKIALIKVANTCISVKRTLDSSTKISEEARRDAHRHCKEIEDEGVIYDLKNNHYGFDESWF